MLVWASKEVASLVLGKLIAAAACGADGLLEALNSATHHLRHATAGDEMAAVPLGWVHCSCQPQLSKQLTVDPTQ